MAAAASVDVDVVAESKCCLSSLGINGHVYLFLGFLDLVLADAIIVISTEAVIRAETVV